MRKFQVHPTADFGGGTTPGPITVTTGPVTLNDDVQLVLGTGSDAAFEYDTANTPDTLKLGVSSDSNAVVVCEKADMQTDFMLNGGTGTAYINPAIVVQRADVTDVGDRSLLQWDTLHKGAPTTDALATPLRITPPNAYPGATGANQVGSRVHIGGGIGSRFITVVDWSLIDVGDAFTIVTNGAVSALDGFSVTFTNGTEFTAATSNAATATLMAAAVNANANIAKLVIASTNGAVVYLTPRAGCLALNLTTTAAAGEFTVTMGGDGSNFGGKGNMIFWHGRETAIADAAIEASTTGVLTLIASNGISMGNALSTTSTLSVGAGFTASTTLATTTSNIAIANTDTTFAVTKSCHTITQTSGASTIATITGGVSGQELDLYFTNTGVTFTDTAVAGATAGQLVLNGAFVPVAGTIITLKLLPVGAASALVWVEKARSANG